MSTHATLVIKNPAAAEGAEAYGTIEVHFDGYPQGIGYELLNHFAGVEHAATMLRLGNLDAILRGEIRPHEFELDQHPAKWFEGSQQAIDSVKYTPAAYAYFWDGAAWHGLNPDGKLVKVFQAKHW